MAVLKAAMWAVEMADARAEKKVALTAATKDSTEVQKAALLVGMTADLMGEKSDKMKAVTMVA
jgi:hypothetical protein